MKKVEIVVPLFIVFAVFYQAAPFIGVADEVIFTLFFLSPFVMLYVVYVILKYGKPSEHTFEERFYDDWDYKRNGREEMDILN
jgi:hypothetical protein